MLRNNVPVRVSGCVLVAVDLALGPDCYRLEWMCGITVVLSFEGPDFFMLPVFRSFAFLSI